MRALACLVVLVLAGCDRSPAESASAPAPTPAPAPAPAPPSTRPAIPVWKRSDDPKLAKFLGLAAPKPAIWIEHPPRGRMRVTTYTVPGRGGHEAAHIVVFYFGEGLGGPAEQNIARWQTQFEPDADGNLIEPIVETFEVDGMPVTVVELAGSWMKMGAAWYTPDQLFLSVIVESPVGNIFIRFAGETATVEANRDDFRRMIDGLRKTGC